ncbi:lipocalin family protein [Cellulophaga sp. 20_2_10]|uniref:lipocalin family protein n=1 Tax=Cellulophaga sp. 20_2_10 TaxID=2942476 RepID=UPI00201AB9FE|nr:lipocalin family protein [Cellulophaga sp. 20_2_10]MCL5246643.1 lipocalin family protein [Cellulophaga sp. 20_2_10]
MKNLKLPILLLFLLILTTACTSDDDAAMESYTIEDLSKMHNNSSKTWKLEAYYSDHNSKQKSKQNDCFIDDTYIFKPDGIVEIISGTENCYYGANELAEAEYTFYEDKGLLFLTIIRGEVTDDLVKTTSFSLQLLELTENRMVFSSGDKNNYKKSLIFITE